MDPQAGLPSDEQLMKAAEMQIFDSEGNQLQFGQLFQDQKTVVVFIRHFFCGACQAYVSQLATISSDSLSKGGVNIVVVGCGEYQAIKSYAEITGFKGPIYADPKRNLFRQFGLIEHLSSTPSGQAKKSYLAGSSFIGMVVGSIWRGPIKNPALIGKQGNISQLGGDFIFGPGMTCSFASRMKHTEDHIEVKELMAEAGVEYSQ